MVPMIMQFVLKDICVEFICCIEDMVKAIMDKVIMYEILINMEVWIEDVARLTNGK